jgi:ATP-dependent Clp protease adaptor protein ClpS
MGNKFYSGDTEELTEKKSETKESNGKVIILHNDDYNSFNHVEKCLVSLCDHSSQQASQCAMIVHYRGKCDVKRGDEKTLKKIYLKMKAELLTVTFEEN